MMWCCGLALPVFVCCRFCARRWRVADCVVASAHVWIGNGMELLNEVQVAEGRPPVDHLVENASEGPHVRGSADFCLLPCSAPIASRQNGLWGHVVQSANLALPSDVSGVVLDGLERHKQKEKRWVSRKSKQMAERIPRETIRTFAMPKSISFSTPSTNKKLAGLRSLWTILSS